MEEADEEGVDEESVDADGGFLAVLDEVVGGERTEVLRAGVADERVDGRFAVDVELGGGVEGVG